MLALCGCQIPASSTSKRNELNTAYVIGLRPQIESHVPAGVVDIISGAWATEPSARPTFHELLQSFRDPSQEFATQFESVEKGLWQLSSSQRAEGEEDSA